MATNLKVSGLGVFSAGTIIDTAGTESVVLSDPERGTYRKMVIEDGRLAGAVLFGDTTDALWYLDLIRSGTPIAHIRGTLVFGRAFTEPDSVAA